MPADVRSIASAVVFVPCGWSGPLSLLASLTHERRSQYSGLCNTSWKVELQFFLGHWVAGVCSVSVEQRRANTPMIGSRSCLAQTVSGAVALSHAINVSGLVEDTESRGRLWQNAS